MDYSVKQLSMAGTVLMASAFATETTAQEAPTDFTEIVAEMSPSVVAITTSRVVEHPVGGAQAIPPELRDRLEEWFGGAIPERAPPPREARAQGSGFLISGEGHIVTNHHVIAEASEIVVRLGDGGPHPATLVGSDPATDLAVLHIEAPDDLVVAEWGDSEAMQPGAWTIAIGSPFGLGGTVTVGVLSALSRDIRTGPYDDYLQTDASINRGNSGGPLFNAGGEVIGVNTAIFSPTGVNVGIGFAVPSRTAQRVVDELIEVGEVRRGFLGARLQPLTEPLARALGLENTSGAIVSDTEPGGPAEGAGLRAGDVVLELDDVGIADPRALSFAVADREPGQDIALSVHRDGERIEVDVTLGTRRFAEAPTPTEPPVGSDADDVRLGLSLVPLPGAMRQALEIEEGGVVVRNVQPGSIAAEAGLIQNDIILQAGQQRVIEPADVASAWQAARDEDLPMVMQVRRGEATLFVAMEG